MEKIEKAMGWIRVHRELLRKPIWLNSTPEHCKILVALLLMANHEQGQWEWMGQKFKVNPGQFVTSIDGIKSHCGKGISFQNIRSALKRFEKLGFLTNKSTKCGRLITILNYEGYQGEKRKTNKEGNKPVTNHQQTYNKPITTNNNDNNDKKKKEIYNKEKINPKDPGSEDLIEDLKFLLRAWFNLSEETHPLQLQNIHCFLMYLAGVDQLKHFKEQFYFYQKLKKESGERRHGFKNYLGTKKNNYGDGGWNCENWRMRYRHWKNSKKY